MRHNLRAELRESMDSLQFSHNDKDRMVYQLMQKAQPRQTYSFRRVGLVIAAAVMLVAMLTGAAVFTRWSDTAQQRYNPSQEIKEQAAQSGLSVMLDENSDQVLSVTDQGITITAVQTIVDQQSAEIIFRVEGFEFPEGRFPALWPHITLDGTTDFYSVQTNDFRMDGNAFEYIHYIKFDEDAGKYYGKELVAVFDSVALQSEEPAGMAKDAVTGHWELRWTFTGTDETVHLTPNTEIGNSGVTLMEANIGQKTIRTTYQLDTYWAGWETLETFQPQLRGVKMTDDTLYSCYATTEGYQNMDQLIFFVESNMTDGLLDLSKVGSLVFSIGDDTIEIPIA